MARPSKTPSRTLAKVPAASQAAPVAADAPAFKARADVDQFDLNNGVLEHYGFDRLTGSAVEQIMEARGLKGEQRRSKLARAIRYLTIAEAQAAVTGLAMCIALPAWLGVMAHCIGVL